MISPLLRKCYVLVNRFKYLDLVQMMLCLTFLFNIAYLGLSETSEVYFIFLICFKHYNIIYHIQVYSTIQLQVAFFDNWCHKQSGERVRLLGRGALKTNRNQMGKAERF